MKTENTIIKSEDLTLKIVVSSSEKSIEVKRSSSVMDASNPELVEICQNFIPYFNKFKAKARRINRSDLIVDFSLIVMKLHNIIGVLQTTKSETIVNRNSLRMDLKHYQKLSFELTNH